MGKMICYEEVQLHHNRAFIFANIPELPKNRNLEN